MAKGLWFCDIDGLYGAKNMNNGFTILIAAEDKAEALFLAEGYGKDMNFEGRWNVFDITSDTHFDCDYIIKTSDMKSPAEKALKTKLHKMKKLAEEAYIQCKRHEENYREEFYNTLGRLIEEESNGDGDINYAMQEISRAYDQYNFILKTLQQFEKIYKCTD